MILPHGSAGYRGILLWLPIFLVAVALGGRCAHALSYLTRCSGTDGNGDAITISADPLPVARACTSVALSIDARQILAAVPAPHRRPNAPDPETITVVGSRIGETFRLRSVAMAPASLSTPPPYLVPGSDLRAVAGIHAFGPPGRAEVQEDADQSSLSCAPGADTAGLGFATLRVPPIPGMGLRIVHSADQSFRLVVSDPANGAQEPRLVAELENTESASESYVPVTAALPADTPLDLELVCPASGGHLQLERIVLEAQGGTPTERAAWIDDPHLWLADPAQIFSRAQRWDLTRLYLTVPMGAHEPKDAEALAAFISEANDRGIEVWALLRDDPAVADLAAVGGAFADYNQAVPPSAQLKGAVVEYDPNRRWIYAADPDAAARQFLDRLGRVRNGLALPLLAIVPAWFPTDATVAESYGSLLDGMVVLTDRTEPEEVRKSVTRFLAWGTRHGKPVEIAFETGPDDPGEQARFAAADSGELWLIPAGGDRMLLLLREAAAGLPGRAFAHQESAEIDPASRSFLGRRSELRELLEPMGRSLGAWPSFRGFAFHDLFREQN